MPAQEIYLDNNQIENIENWSFGPSVNTLYLSCNKLKKISSKWFTNTSNLRELDISGNEISFLQKNTFKPFSSLSLIALSHNKIARIGAGAFGNTKTFWILYLNNNKLTKLPVDAFQKGALEIHSMHLQYNSLTYLDAEFIRKTNTSKARLQGNPWLCACYEIIKKWNTWDSVEYDKDPKGPPVCIPAPPNKPDCAPDVDLDVIADYERKYPPKENREHFCKTYLKK